MCQMLNKLVSEAWTMRHGDQQALPVMGRNAVVFVHHADDLVVSTNLQCVAILDGDIGIGENQPLQLSPLYVYRSYSKYSIAKIFAAHPQSP